MLAEILQFLLGGKRRNAGIQFGGLVLRIVQNLVTYVLTVQ